MEGVLKTRPLLAMKLSSAQHYQQWSMVLKTVCSEGNQPV